jgi:hypothetical protein
MARDRSADRAPIAARVLSLATVFATLLMAFLLFVRPWYRTWGATAEELRRSLPGDEIIPRAADQETRAITIHTPMTQVWPWLAQLGQDRGGFYSFDLLENLVGCQMPTDDRLRLDRQSWRVGDKLWMCPANKTGGIGFPILRVYAAGRALGFGTRASGTSVSAPDDGSWSFVLEPVDASTTRLLIRGRGAVGRFLLGTAFDRAVFEPLHFVMERRMMIGLQEVAEGRSRGRRGNHVLVALWAVEFVLIVAAIVGVLRRPSLAGPLAGCVVTCIVFLVLTLAQPSIGVGALLVLVSGAIVWWR